MTNDQIVSKIEELGFSVFCSQPTVNSSGETVVAMRVEGGDLKYGSAYVEGDGDYRFKRLILEGFLEVVEQEVVLRAQTV